MYLISCIRTYQQHTVKRFQQLFQADVVIMHSRIAFVAPRGITPVDFMHVLHLLLFMLIYILHRTISAKRDLEKNTLLPRWFLFKQNSLVESMHAIFQITKDVFHVDVVYCYKFTSNLKTLRTVMYLISCIRTYQQHTVIRFHHYFRPMLS